MGAQEISLATQSPTICLNYRSLQGPTLWWFCRYWAEGTQAWFDATVREGEI